MKSFPIALIAQEIEYTSGLLINKRSKRLVYVYSEDEKKKVMGQRVELKPLYGSPYRVITAREVK